jgi:polysaccharide export outer membrane protein
MKFNNIVIILSIVFLSACTSSRPYVPTAAETKAAARSVDALNKTPEYQAQASSATFEKKSRPAPARAASQAPAVVSDRLSSGDILDVNVFKVPDLSAKALTVESSGTISLPLVGTIAVAGLSIAQAEQKITQRLTEFMHAPQVSISRTNKAIEKRVTVEGAVRTPGVFPIKGNLSFLQAIALAQGLSEVGDSRTVYFYRDGARHLVNLDLVRNGTISDPLLRSDDRIVVMKDPDKVREKKVLEYLPAVTAPFSVLGL